MFMFSFLVGLSLFSSYSGRSLQEPASIKTQNYDFDNIAEGSYSFNYETSDGTSRQEFGHVLLPGTEDEHMKVNGSFSYLGPDGIFYEVRYTADDQGFHPEGDHIKVPPFVPWIHRHGQHAEGNSNIPTYTNNNDNFNTIETTPKPTTQYLPKYTPVETKENVYSTTSRPTTMYLPLESKFHSTTSKPTTLYLPLDNNNIDHVTGESNLKIYRPKPTTTYLPTASNSALKSSTYRSAYSSTGNADPDPEIILFSTPQDVEK